jgi:hypothetical protein
MVMQSQNSIHNYVLKFIVKSFDDQLATRSKPLQPNEFDLEEINSMRINYKKIVFSQKACYLK